MCNDLVGISAAQDSPGNWLVYGCIKLLAL